MKKNLPNKWLAGVCSGISDYFNINPTIIRFIWIIAALTSGLFITALIYLFASIIMD